MLLITDWWKSPKGAIIVAKDSEIDEFKTLLAEIAQAGNDWANWLTRIISLETANRKIAEGDVRYCRIETWPEDQPIEPSPAEPTNPADGQPVLH